ncbi:hypothetical protein MMC20_002565 [Loxospora ochrophaea]|nr:hypothetical protein [Loxospora ochrophaea]
METENTESQKREDEKNLEIFRIFLDVPEAQDNAHINIRKISVIHRRPGAEPLTPKGYLGMTLEEFITEKAYLNWKYCDSSCILVLSGLTTPGAHTHPGSASSLLSSVTFFMLSMLQKMHGPKKPFLFYNCCPRDNTNEKVDFQTLSSNLLYQTAALKPSVLRKSKDHEFLGKIGKGAWYAVEDKQEMRDRTIQKWCEMLKVMDVKDEIHIIIDRADQCASEPDHLLMALVDLLRGAACRLKVLVTIDQASWKLEQAQADGLRKYAGDDVGFLSKLNWDQKPGFP